MELPANQRYPGDIRILMSGRNRPVEKKYEKIDWAFDIGGGAFVQSWLDRAQIRSRLNPY